MIKIKTKDGDTGCVVKYDSIGNPCIRLDKWTDETIERMGGPDQAWIILNENYYDVINDDYISPNMDYIPGNVEHNVKVAVQKLKENYYSKERSPVSNGKEFVKAEKIIINAILFHGYTVEKEKINNA